MQLLKEWGNNCEEGGRILNARKPFAG